MRLDIQKFAVTKSTSYIESNISIENNTSSITIYIEFSANDTTTVFTGKTLTCVCNGVTKSKKISYPIGKRAQANFTFDNIEHTSDGSKTVSWNWSCPTGTSAIGTITSSGSFPLTQIQRPSLVSVSSGTKKMGDELEITITKNFSNASHRLTYIFLSQSSVIGATSASSYLWTPPRTLANEIPDSLSDTCYIICKTYDNDTLIGQTETHFTLQIADNEFPTIDIGTLTEADTTMQSLNWGVFVQNKSKLNIPITATGVYSSTIQSIVTTINGLSFTGTPVVTPTLTTTGTNTITTTVTDSRGRTISANKTYTVVPYANPNIQIAQVERCLYDKTLSENGTYLLIDYKASISSVSNNNSKLHRIGYKKTSDLSYTYVNLSSNYEENIQDQLSSFTISADYDYDIVFEAIDSFMTSTIERTLQKGFDLLNFNPNGKALAIGTISSATANQELLEINLETEFLKACNFEELTIANQPIIITDSFEQYTGATASDSTNTLTYDVSKTNCTPIGIVGINCDHSRASLIRLFRWWIEGNEAKVSYRNVGTNSLVANDTTITIYVAYIRS